MALTHHRGRSRFTFALLILSAVTLITLDSRGFGPLEWARSATMASLGPLNDGAGVVFSPLGDAWSGAWRQGDLEEENAELRARIEELEGRETMAGITEQALRDFLAEADITWASDREKVPARVVSGPAGNFDDTIEIDEGSSAGIGEGMAVVTGAGLVGRVVSVSDHRSKVQLISDPSVTIGVRLVGSGDLATATGQGPGRALRANNVEQDTTVEIGELVATSGLSRSLFPSDIPVGEVVRVDEAPGDPAKSLLVEPLARLDDLTMVSVILEEPPE